MINWRKGLFRVWIVSATFWMISIVVLNIGEYIQASKKESRLKQIVSEIKDPEKAFNKIIENFPEYTNQYNLIDLGLVDKNKPDVEWGLPVKSKESTGGSDGFLPKPKYIPKQESNPYLKEEVDISQFAPPDVITKGIINKICTMSENDRRDKLLTIMLLSIFPPIILLMVGSSIYWAIRGFRVKS